MKEIDYLNYLVCLRKNIHDISEIKYALSKDDFSIASGFWYDLSDIDQQVLYSLSTKDGGIFTTEERSKMKYPEFRKAYFADSKNEIW